MPWWGWALLAWIVVWLLWLTIAVSTHEHVTRLYELLSRRSE